MPIYEYQCNKCDHRLEALQKISDAPLLKCPECGKKSLRKLVSAAAFRLSGSGWYETDFKDKKQQKNLSNSDNKETVSKDGGKDAGKDGGKDGGKGEAKPADGANKKETAKPAADSSTGKKNTKSSPAASTD